MSSEISILAEGVSKAYTIYRRPEDRLKQMFAFGRRKYYQEYWALRDASLTVRRGETVGLVGRNGSGKSTFLQLICGTLTPTAGRISVDGRIAALLELGAGFNPEFTGRENVYIASSILGLSREDIDSRFDAILDFAGIGDFIDQPVKVYSSGMYARLAFAVAAHVDADILVVDEILAVGDAAFTQRCMRYIHRFKEKGTLLFVSHDTGAIASLCDRVVWLDRGEIRAVGDPKEICHDYLAAQVEELDDSGSFRIGGERKRRDPPKPRPVKDQRAEALRQSSFGNRLEIFEFDPGAPWFGQRGASITGVTLSDASGEPLAVAEGGEEVILRVDAQADQPLNGPIIGWMFKNRLGQCLFSDNTFVPYQFTPLQLGAGGRFHASFRFQLPYLPPGDYSFAVAVAEGTQQNHVQHHWIDDALFLQVSHSHLVHALLGIPMQEITLQVDNE